VMKGFKHIHVVDYDESFEPVAMLKSVWILLEITIYFDCKI
jgi:hypothetical protein